MVNSWRKIWFSQLNTKFSCITPTPMQHHSFFRNYWTLLIQFLEEAIKNHFAGVGKIPPTSWNALKLWSILALKSVDSHSRETIRMSSTDYWYRSFVYQVAFWCLWKSKKKLTCCLKICYADRTRACHYTGVRFKRFYGQVVCVPSSFSYLIG